MEQLENIQQLRQASKAYSDALVFMHEAIAQAAGLSGADHKYLGILVEHGAMTAGDLARYTGLTTGAITGLIDRLERRGLVERQAAAGDRRKILVFPKQENIMQLLQPLFGGIHAATARLLETFTAEELATIARYFVSATALMKEETNKIQEQL